MATSEKDLLDHIKTTVLAFTPASPAVDTTRVYVTPDEYSNVDPTPPFILIEIDREPIPVNLKAKMGEARYTVGIWQFLGEGELIYPSQEYATGDLAAREWRRETIDWVMENRKPLSTYGQITGPLTFEFTGFHFNAEPYYGQYTRIPVLQYV